MDNRLSGVLRSGSQHKSLLWCKRILLSAIVICFVILVTKHVTFLHNLRFSGLANFNPGPVVKTQILQALSQSSRPSVQLKHNHCSLPTRGIKSWKQGVVSVLKPEIQRNCPALFSGTDKIETKRVKNANVNDKAYVYKYPDRYERDAKKCKIWCDKFSDRLFYTSEEETRFPLAFLFVVNRNPQQLIRLITSIYRPHNIYCIHVDNKSSTFTKNIVSNLTKCVPNIIVPQEPVNVYRGHISIVTAQLKCIQVLHSKRDIYDWKYVITLCGMELPLKTNREMVRALRPLNGTSVVRAALLNSDEMQRRFKFKRVLDLKAAKNKKTGTPLDPPPYNITVYKSLAYNALSVQFVEHVLNDSMAQEVYEYMKFVGVPEEYYFATLFMLPGTPGGYDPSKVDAIPTTSSVIWLIKYKKQDWPKMCSGTVVHFICIVSSGDLHRLRKFIGVNDRGGLLKSSFFHNKYFMESDRTVMDCMEEELVRRNKREYQIDCDVRLA